MGTLGSEETPSYYSKYNIRQKMLFAKLISTSPEEYFQPFFETLKTLEPYTDFERTIFDRVVKTAFYVSGETFRSEIFFWRKIIIA